MNFIQNTKHIINQKTIKFPNQENKNTSSQQAVWRHAGCLLAESFAGI